MFSCYWTAKVELNNYRVWNGAIVPSRQKIIQNNPHSLFEIIGDFSSGLIDGLNNLDEHFQSFAGRGLFDELLDQIDTCEKDALTGSGNMRKEAMLNRIVFGTVGRIMGNPNFLVLMEFVV